VSGRAKVSSAAQVLPVGNFILLSNPFGVLILPVQGGKLERQEPDVTMVLYATGAPSCEIISNAASSRARPNAEVGGRIAEDPHPRRWDAEQANPMSILVDSVFAPGQNKRI